MMATHKCVCGTLAISIPYTHDDRASDYYTARHLAPCGAVCQSGSRNGPDYRHDEKHHCAPFEGPYETDGHYHGEYPKGCFVECCKPRGNLCGDSCQHCFPPRSEWELDDYAYKKWREDGIAGLIEHEKTRAENK